MPTKNPHQDALTIRQALLLQICLEARTAPHIAMQAAAMSYSLSPNEARITLDRLAARGMLDKARQQSMYRWRTEPPTYKTTPAGREALRVWRRIAGELTAEPAPKEPTKKPAAKPAKKAPKKKPAATSRRKKKHSTRRR